MFSSTQGCQASASSHDGGTTHTPLPSARLNSSSVSTASAGSPSTTVSRITDLLEETNNISPTGHKYSVTAVSKATIMKAPERAIRFVESSDAATLKREIDEKVDRYRNEIICAALIENINVRGRIIEYLIAGEDEVRRQEIIAALQSEGARKGIPAFRTENTLGDYQRVFERFFTETDIKTKIMILSSNPKAYNLDKVLEFLTHEKSVFMFYFVGVDPTRIVNTVLVSMFQVDLLRSTILLKHWSGRKFPRRFPIRGKDHWRSDSQPEAGYSSGGSKGVLGAGNRAVGTIVGIIYEG